MEHTDVSVRNLLGKQPEFTNDTPLDRFFQDLHRDVFEPLQSCNGIQTDIYACLQFTTNKQFIAHILHLIQSLHDIVRTIKQKDDNLLPISLHDMKYVDFLLNLVIIHGIDANLPADLKIPMDGKRLTNFKKDHVAFHIPASHKIDYDTLATVVDYFNNLLTDKSNTEDYLRSIILKGPTFTNIFIGTLALSLNHRNAEQYETILLQLESIQETYSLFAMYTLLTEIIVNSKTKVKILQSLSTLIIRREDDGLISLVDFILGVRENEDITAEKMNRINQIVLAKPPKGIPNATYLEKLFNQIYDALGYINRPVLVNCINSIVKDFYFRNQRIVKDFLFKKIYQVLFNIPTHDHSPKELNDMINVLISLSKNPSIDVIYDLVYGLDSQQFYLNIWIYSLFLKKNQKLDPLVANNLKKGNIGPYYEVVLSLLKSFIVLLNKYDDSLNCISLNLLNFDHPEWEYKINLETQLPYIIKKSETIDINSHEDNAGEKMNEISRLFQDMDTSIEMFVQFLRLLDNEDSIKDIFLVILRRWVQNTSESKHTNSTSLIDDNDKQNENLLILMDLKLLEKLNEEFKTDIISNTNDVLRVVIDLLGYDTTTNITNYSDDDSDDEDDETKDETNTSTMNILLELLEATLDQNSATNLLKYKTMLITINEKLQTETFRNDKCKELHARLSKIIDGKVDTKVLQDMKQNESVKNDNHTLDKALKNLSDPLVPIKANGLMLLRELIEKKSTVISLDRVLKLHFQYLRSSDPFIYLNVIKGLSSLCETNAEETIQLVVGFYQNKQNKNKLDDILKIGEVLINYIQHENELFQGKYANMIIDICLEKINQHEYLDNRIRMSAMSILGICLQVNAKGIESRIGEMLDCVFGILQLETDTNKSKKDDSFIMRRSAVHLIHDLIYNSGLALLPEKYTPDKLLNILKYSRSNDNDYLVCEQINQVLAVLAQFMEMPPLTDMEAMD